MQCFREHYRRCGRGEPRKGAGNNDVSCGCVLDGEDKTPHHELVSTFVEKLRAWAAKRPSKEEQGLIGRLAKYQGKRNQEPAAVAAILKGEGIVVNEAKIKCKKEWGVRGVNTLNPSFFGWVAKEGAEVSSGVGDAGGAGGAAASGGGVQVGGGEAGTVSVVTRVTAKGSMVNFEMKVVVDPGVVMAQVGGVEASAQPMDDVTAAKRTYDAWFTEALDDASIPDLEKPVATNVAYPQDVEARVGYLQREQERLNSDADQLRKNQVRVSHYTLHEQEQAAVARTNYKDAMGTVNYFLETKKQVEEELSGTGLHLLKHFHLLKPAAFLQAEANAQILQSIQMTIVKRENKLVVQKIRTEEMTMSRLRTKLEGLDKLLTNTEHSLVPKEEALVQKQQAELQLSKAKERRNEHIAEYEDACAVRREELAREISRNEEEFRRSFDQDRTKKPVPMPPPPGEPGHEEGMRAFARHAREERSRALGKLTGGERAFLERNRQVRFDLDAEMFILGGDPYGLCIFDDQFQDPLRVAVDSHPDVLAAKASMVPKEEQWSAQHEFFAAVAALDRAEQRVLANVESPPVDECTRVLAACGPFDVFGVPRDANEADMRARYKELALALHPDKAGDAGEEAMKRVNEARAVLEDPEQRAAYDAKYPLGGFMTTLTRKLAIALDEQEKARCERLSYALQIRIDLEKLLPPKGAATTCMPARSKKLEKTPQVQLLRMLPVKLDTFGRNTASVNWFEADDTSTRVAVLNCLIGTFQVELPFEVVTLADDRALLFPQLASAVHDRLDKIIRPRVVEMSDAALLQAIAEATTSPLVTALQKQLDDDFDQLSSDQRLQISYKMEEETEKVNARLPRELLKLLEDEGADEDALREEWRKHLKPKLKELLPEFPRTYKRWAERASQTGLFVEKGASPARPRPTGEESQSKWPRLM